jgi:uncharacterized repeat protein (TIGR04076 family)
LRACPRTSSEMEDEMTVVRITVLKRALHADLAKAHSGSQIKPCEVFKDGQEFIAGFNMPEGFCDWAWTDISRMTLALLTGGSFDRGVFKGWMKRDNTAVACCTDGFRPVTFKLERVDTKDLIDLSGTVRPAPLEAYESERWGEFAYTFPGLDPGARYAVRLHFCEVYFSASGRRRFGVECGGKSLLEEFDVIAEAGGAFKPVIREFEAVADGNGALALSFLKGTADNPKVSAIEISRSGSGAAQKPVYAVNAGGGACGAFSADRFFSGGNTLGG